MGYGIYFLSKNQIKSDSGDDGDNSAVVMVADCSDLVKFFFLNEVTVGTLTFIHCIALMICFRKSKLQQEAANKSNK